MQEEEQEAQLSIQDPEMIVALGAVNFRLGAGWNKIHVKTWDLIAEGKYTEAAQKSRTQNGMRKRQQG